MTKLSTAALAKIGLLAAIGFMLMFLEFHLPVFPSFLKLDLSELPVLVGAMALGPMAGVLIELIVNLLNLTKTTTGGVGEIANFIIGCGLVVPIGIIYNKRRDNTGYIAGAIAGTLSMLVIACLSNYFILIPLYSKFMPIDVIIGMAGKINGSVVDLKTLVLFCIAPFNIVKGICITVIGYALFPALKPVLLRGARA